MNIGVSTYSFSGMMHKEGLSLLDVIGRAAEMGFEAIEFLGFAPPAGKTAEGWAKQLGDECRSRRLAIAAYTVGADLLNGSGGNLSIEIERLKGEVRIARALGAPAMRHDATGGFPAAHRGPRGFDNALPILAEGCRAVAEYAAGLGIRTMVENHGFFCQDSDRVEKLANAVAHPSFGLLVDVGNFLCADEDPALAVGRVARYAFHVHVKDFHVKPGDEPDPGRGWFRSRAGNFLRGAIVGHGNVPVLQCLRVLKAAGYAGALSIEFEGMEDPAAGIAIGAENLRRYAAAC